MLLSLCSTTYCRTHSKCVAIFKSSVPYIRKNFNKFQNNVLVLVNKALLNQQMKNLPERGALPYSHIGAYTLMHLLCFSQYVKHTDFVIHDL